MFTLEASLAETLRKGVCERYHELTADTKNKANKGQKFHSAIMYIYTSFGLEKTGISLWSFKSFIGSKLRIEKGNKKSKKAIDQPSDEVIRTIHQEEEKRLSDAIERQNQLNAELAFLYREEL